ncbi:hypothetical protein AwDysgo_14140 [Bacteroidales bacterium]|nr:hypothetical protein AwDysgo_14140 [Bacteroidales bacterium]
MQNKLEELNATLGKMELNLKEDFRINRQENATIAKDNRIELNTTLKDFIFEQRTNFEELKKEQTILTVKTVDQLEKISTKVEERLHVLNQQAKVDALLMREALESTFKGFGERIDKNSNSFNELQKSKFEELKKEQTILTVKTVDQLEKISTKVEERLHVLNQQAKGDALLMREALESTFKGFGERIDKNSNSFNELQKSKFEALEKRQKELIEDTEKKLESIRITVEEKLEKTLSERLGQSFETVGKQLIEVQKGLGEMQTIAADVGGLKKVLSNVKLRGGVGEVQLALLLEQILAPNQYESNVKTKKGSSNSVEFAVKLPGRSQDENAVVYLPIDAKFPKDTYEHLINAYESGIPEDIESATKNMDITIRKMAKDIRDKYIDPPNTTDFAILFLPFESIYAEVIRRSALVDQLRDEYKITLAGPTTLMAILNSLQMGFRTLSIQKRSSEVWKILSSVKKEFENFGGLLGKAQKNIQTGLSQLEDMAGTRTRAIQRQLNKVELVTALEEKNILSENNLEILENTVENPEQIEFSTKNKTLNS